MITGSLARFPRLTAPDDNYPHVVKASWVKGLHRHSAGQLHFTFMNSSEPTEQPENPNQKQSENPKEPLTHTALIEFASVLDDYMDEEVVDKEGAAIGTLACYWQSVSGRLVFLGIKVGKDEGIRVVPG